MTNRLVLTPRAAADLEEIGDFIAARTSHANGLKHWLVMAVLVTAIHAVKSPHKAETSRAFPTSC